MDLDSARGALIEEARDLLNSMESALLTIEGNNASSEEIDALFRVAHTIKGSAALFSLDYIVIFTHSMESLLDLVRSREIEINEKMISTLLDCKDYLSLLINSVENRTENIDPDEPNRARLLGLLDEYLLKSTEVQTIASSDRIEKDEKKHHGDTHWHLSLRFNKNNLINGMDPFEFIRYLSTLGEISYIYTITDKIPPLDEIETEQCYLGFEIDLESSQDKEAIESAFDFIRQDSTIRILPPHAKIQEYIDLINSLPEPPQLLGEILLKGGSITALELKEILNIQKADPSRQLGSIFVEEKVVAAPVVAAALKKQKQSEDKKNNELKFIKVEAGKLDTLINMVGELVIAGAAANLISKRNSDPSMSEACATLSDLVEQIRDSALNLRMVQIKEVFERFPRVIRDATKDLNKKINLKLIGTETELDKSMIEKLSDPLMHIVRNAIDHGIEAPQDRIAKGKPAQGEIILNAFHDSGSVVIEISDDGAGLNKERIINKAIERSLISPDAILSEYEIYQLIFEAGFSTAEKVTHLSGRGVGMDVVKRNIEHLRGEVEVISEEGTGSIFRIRLPLTMAIIDGFQVMVADSTFVIPLDLVLECTELTSDDEQHSFVNLRGKVLPFVRLRSLFDFPEHSSSKENIVVIQYGQNRAGLVVDKLIGEFQAVIKPLGPLFKDLKGISGSTILGTGQVALILDVGQLIQYAYKKTDPLYKGNSIFKAALPPSASISAITSNTLGG
ncbi:chemotaxis protein CheA [Janthinobacterium sp. B9-8]|uniref:chemotaxis protein CheA n=1 Tax=Janthinobacterium sp. B9-8 TaxID=1236179 RepID=UPI00061CE3D6|nr:chemotaxis protein CheA [Janthinobacterium sp. B9-8]AMC34013.1 chemotaxis protein CheA [Janthinobacterium sp. B9-8]